jgi:8-amino-7-oxononanoate synthase
MSLAARLSERLSSRRASHLYRQRTVIETLDGSRARIDGRWYTNFSSNDYLGLSQTDAVKAAWADTAYGAVGSGASAMVSGYTSLHRAVEEALAGRLGLDAALLFPSGYAANLGVIGAICERDTAVFHDRLNHASLLDATRIAGAKLYRFAHADPAALADRLHATRANRRLVVSEGVFSMDGDIAPLPALLDTLDAATDLFLLDDAHGFGVLGAHGNGSPEHHGLAPARIGLRVVTFSKALGLAGACVLGSADVIDLLVQYARPYIYSTALPPPLCNAVLAALELLDTEAWRRRRLARLIDHFSTAAAARGLTTKASRTAIQAIVLGANRDAVAAAAALRARGLLVTAFRPPTVPRGTARLRLGLSALHDETAIDTLLDAVAEVVHEQA